MPELAYLPHPMPADGTLLMPQDLEISVAVNKLQEGLDFLAGSFRRWRMTLDPDKTEGKIFALHRFDVDIIYPIIVNALPLLLTKNHEPVKYLGLHLDTKLSW